MAASDSSDANRTVIQLTDLQLHLWLFRQSLYTIRSVSSCLPTTHHLCPKFSSRACCRNPKPGTTRGSQLVSPGHSFSARTSCRRHGQKYLVVRCPRLFQVPSIFRQSFITPISGVPHWPVSSNVRPKKEYIQDLRHGLLTFISGVHHLLIPLHHLSR